MQDSKNAFIPEFVGEEPEINTDVWNKTITRMIYEFRVTESEKVILDHILQDGNTIQLYDYVKGITNEDAVIEDMDAHFEISKGRDDPIEQQWLITLKIARPDASALPPADTSYQLREHRAWAGYNSYITFTKPTSTVLRIDDNAAGYMANGYFFKNYPRNYLNGKTIRITWRGYWSYAPTPRDYARLEVVDGSYTRSSMTDFPDFQGRTSKGAGLLEYLYHNLTFGWVTETLGPLDLSAGTEQWCSLFVLLTDYWEQQNPWIEIDTIEIMSGATVLETIHFLSAVTMEQSGTYNDYGTVSS